PAGRHEAGEEDVTVPGLELQFGAGRLQLHDERLAVPRHRRLAEARIDEASRERREGWGRPRAGGPGELLLRFLVEGFRSLEALGHVVAPGVVEQPVQQPSPETIG